MTSYKWERKKRKRGQALNIRPGSYEVRRRKGLEAMRLVGVKRKLFFIGKRIGERNVLLYAFH